MIAAAVLAANLYIGVKRHRQVHRVVTPAVVGSSPTAPVFLFNAIVICVVETIAELLILAMAMFLAAFFCLRVLLLPDAKITTIEKIYEVEETIYQKR